MKFPSSSLECCIPLVFHSLRASSATTSGSDGDRNEHLLKMSLKDEIIPKFESEPDDDQHGQFLRMALKGERTPQFE